MASLVTVAVYNEPAEAIVARSCLDAHGLVAILPEWHHGSVAWHHVYALRGFRLWTINSTAEDARKLLGVATAGHDVAMAEPPTRLVRPDVSIFELVIAAAVLMLTGLPLPFWKRRQRST